MPLRVTSRLVLPGFACCYHITQRCQERRYLLRHAKDRRQYLKRLWETSRRYPISVLNYMITSNHVHLLLWSESPRHVSAAMQYLSGAAAQDYNRRLEREGAFWRGRYRPTLVEDGHHLRT
jgi:putative transposase